MSKGLQVSTSGRLVTPLKGQYLDILKGVLDKQTVLIDRALREMKAVDLSAATTTLKELEAVGSNYSMMARVLKVASGQIAQMFIEHWEDLPRSFTQAYTKGVYEFLQVQFGYGKQSADMYAAVWSAYHSQRIKVPKYVDLGRIPIGKQADAAKYVIAGQMTDKRWRILADDSIDRTIMRHKLRAKDLRRPAGETVVTNASSTTVNFVEETGDLQLFIKGQPEQVGFFNINSKNPVVRQAIRDIVRDLVKTGHVKRVK